MTDMEMLMEDSLDGGPPSVGSGDIPAAIVTPGNTVATPASSKKVSDSAINWGVMSMVCVNFCERLCVYYTIFCFSVILFH